MLIIEVHCLLFKLMTNNNNNKKCVIIKIICMYLRLVDKL